MEHQLTVLYQEKELLEHEIGVSSAEDIITMIRSMEEQLNSLYQDREE